MSLNNLTRCIASSTVQAAKYSQPRSILALEQRMGMKLGVQQLCRVNEKEKNKYVRHPWLNGRLRSVPSLSDELRILTFIAGNTAAGNISGVTLDWCFLSEASHAKGAEAILFNILFTGIPRTLNALAAVKKIGCAQAAVLDPCTPYYSSLENESGYATAGEAHKAKVEKGIDVMKKVYGHQYTRLRSKMRLMHPALDRFITEFVFGRLHSRSVLTPREAHLVTLAALAGQIVVPQFKSNIIQALRAGATVEEVRGVLDQTNLVWGQFAQAAVDALWSDMKINSMVRKVAEWDTMGDNFPINQEHLPYIWNFHSDNTAVTAATQKAFEEKAVQFDPDLIRPINHHPHFARFPARRVDNVTDVVRLLAMLSADTTAGNLTRVARDWGYLPPKYHRQGMEAMLEALVFAGVHKTVNAMIIIEEVGIDKSALDCYEEDAMAKKMEENYDLYYQRGCDLLQKIYKNTYSRLRANLRSVHPDMETFVIEFVYGRVLSRKCEGMGSRERELLSLSCLTGGEIVFPQLHSHMLGALNAGATLNDVRCILDQTGHLWGNRNQAMVDSFWLEFKKKTNERPN